MEVDVSTQLGQNDVPRWFGSVNTVIVAIFCVEIVVKCVAQGLQAGGVDISIFSLKMDGLDGWILKRMDEWVDGWIYGSIYS